MTSKDMNLNMPPRRPEKPRERKAPIGAKPGRRPRPVVAASSLRAGGSESEPVAGGGDVREHRWPSFLLALVLLNTLALPAAGYWLYQHFEASSRAAQVGFLSAADLADATGAVDRNLAALDSRITQLQLTLAEQQRVFNSALLDLQDQVSPSVPEAAKKPGTAQPVAPPAGQLVVNAGTFSTLVAAESVQKQLAPLGYDALLQEVAIAGEPTYKVQITGLDDRASAEEVARQIMAQTGIHGLWVWKDD